MINKETIMEAYVFLRKNNQTIPDETLDFMKDVSLKALEASNTEIIGNVSDQRELLKFFAEGLNEALAIDVCQDYIKNDDIEECIKDFNCR